MVPSVYYAQYHLSSHSFPPFRANWAPNQAKSPLLYAPEHSFSHLDFGPGKDTSSSSLALCHAHSVGEAPISMIRELLRCRYPSRILLGQRPWRIMSGLRFLLIWILGWYLWVLSSCSIRRTRQLLRMRAKLVPDGLHLVRAWFQDKSLKRV